LSYYFTKVGDDDTVGETIAGSVSFIEHAPGQYPDEGSRDDDYSLNGAVTSLRPKPKAVPILEVWDATSSFFSILFIFMHFISSTVPFAQ